MTPFLFVSIVENARFEDTPFASLCILVDDQIYDSCLCQAVQNDVPPLLSKPVSIEASFHSPLQLDDMKLGGHLPQPLDFMLK
jgi:hypothetical protein